MNTRCIHMPRGLCEGCKVKALTRDAELYWMWDESNCDWVFNQNIVRNSMGKAVGMMPHARTDVGVPPVSDGIPVSAGGGGVVDGVRTVSSHLVWDDATGRYNEVKDPKCVPYYDSSGRQFWRYDTGQAVEATIQKMPTDLTNEQVAELRAQLDTALNSATQWQQLASNHPVQFNGTPVTQQIWDELKRNYDKMWNSTYGKQEPTTASKMEVEKMIEKRIGDSDRNAFIEHLGNMFADGHLNENEFSERSDKANAAKTMSELRPLVADLPDMPDKRVAVRIDAKVQRKPLKTWLAQAPTPVFFLVTGGFIAVLFLLTMLLL